MPKKPKVVAVVVAVVVLSFIYWLLHYSAAPVPPPEPPRDLALRPGEASVGLALKSPDDWRGIGVGDGVDVLALPMTRGGGPVLLVSGRVIAMNERERTVVVAVAQGEAAKLIERLKEARPMLAVRKEPPGSTGSAPGTPSQPTRRN